MLRNEPLTAVIPVRGGSKGIPRKNLYKLGRDTLLERAIKLARHATRADRVIVSTDDEEMHSVAQHYGAAAAALRPQDLAGDDVRTEDVIEHLLMAGDVQAGHILLLQATSPLRTLADLEDACDLYEDSPQHSSLVSVSAHNGTHPAKMFTLAAGCVAPYLDRAYTGPRQKLPDVYVPNGAFYIIATQTLTQERSFVPAGTLAFQMPAERSANLDTMADLQILEAMLAAGHWTIEDLD